MIVFSLRCANGHQYDEWFTSSADYETRSAGGDLVCPECGDRTIKKAIMAPRVRSAAASEPAPAAPCVTCGQDGACPWAN